ncbi:unnamed protein product [Protopolystoma xenopodis]|uniref:Peptidase S54 rhomboid domain-containing protein n=1 Tax=Protopolystoma xenopodis TaxID=117903 RepID=A0A448WGH7_9PLAT|nr:unnamed protein product [Protopolystoma xenopodis]
MSTNATDLRLLNHPRRVLNSAIIRFDPQLSRENQRRRLAQSGLEDQVDTYNWGEAEVDNYVEAYDCRPPPIFIPLVTLVEIGVFIYYAIILGRDNDPENDVTSSSGLDLDSPLVFDPRKRYQAWRFVSYMLMHNGYVHLIFNCIFQLCLGLLLEVVHKFWRVGLVYLLGVIAGSLASSVTDRYTFLVGASGGAYALIGAHIATVVMVSNSSRQGLSLHLQLALIITTT